MKEKIKPIKKRIASLWAWMIVYPRRFFIVAIAIFFPLIVGLDLFFFKDGNDWINVLVEAHGLVFDLVVFGFIVEVYHHYRQLHENAKKEETEKRQRIERYLEEIDDFRGWMEPEAMHRIVGCIRRLNKEGVSQINLSKCNLQEANLLEINLSGANLSHSNLSGAKLISTILVGANLSGANLRGATLAGTDFSGAYLIETNLDSTRTLGANFSNAFLAGANFVDASLSRTNFRGADIVTESWELFIYSVKKGKKFRDFSLRGATLVNVNFTDFKGLTLEIVSSASSISKVFGISEEIISQLEKNKPEIFE